MTHLSTAAEAEAPPAPTDRSETSDPLAVPSSIVDVDSVLDGVRFRGLPLTVLVCSAVVLALDGFDIQVIGFVAPALTSEFGVSRAALGPVLAASLLGMAIGGLAVGPIGDRLGRRAAVMISTAIFALSTLLASFAASIETLAVWRFLTGIGLGGAMPNVTALMAEFAPPRWRSLTISAAITGVPVGGMLGAALAAEVIPAFGWRAIFVLGGILPLLWLLAMYFLLPESPRYLAARADRPRELAALLNRIDHSKQYRACDTFVLRHIVEGDTRGVGALFSHELLRDTLSAWLIFGTNIFAVYAIFNWAPVVLTSLGLDLATAVRGLLLFNLAGVVGSLALSLLIPQLGSRRLLALSTLGASASVAWLAWLTHGAGENTLGLPVAALMAGLALAGLTMIAIQVGMFPVMAHLYPIQSRATGVGWAIGVGRLGGIVSSFAGGWFMMNMGGAGGFFAGVAITLVLTFGGAMLMRNHIPPLGRRSQEPFR